MKKIFDNLYFFSKFSVSLLLLISLLFLSYIFFTYYKKQNQINDNISSIEEDFKTNIETYVIQISNLNSEINQIKISIEKIEKMITQSSSQPIEEEISKLNKNYENINESVKNLKNDLEFAKNNFKIENNISKKPSLVKNSINDLVELILIKYENGNIYESELKFLEKTLNNKDEIFEKINFLSNKPFKGYQFLKKNFEEETNKFLKKRIKKEDNLISKIILPYVKISPSLENNIIDSEILIIKKVNNNILNKNIELALYNLSSIKKFQNHFAKTINEMENFIDFKNTLEKLK